MSSQRLGCDEGNKLAAAGDLRSDGRRLGSVSDEAIKSFAANLDLHVTPDALFEDDGSRNQLPDVIGKV
ncbi:hypothetical protein [Agrobacterium deltaense]|uniref:hypothetical protein n=1 Tax=Agrobacterium deltaense TaxID=1183412 RepID=UPI0009D15BE2|nr:hypothetical protein [Agrobacterium deltaense]CUX55986.1 hypothetical protein AGR7B_pAt0249 [Agrobacterium deltaense RV3]